MLMRAVALWTITTMAITTAMAAARPENEPDYVALAKASYRAGIADRLKCHPPRHSGVRAPGCCRGGCAPDSWALAAALIWKHERDSYFRQQAQEVLLFIRFVIKFFLRHILRWEVQLFVYFSPMVGVAYGGS